MRRAARLVRAALRRADSLLQQRGPVDDHGYRLRRLFMCREHEEALAVARDLVRAHKGAWRRYREEFPRCSRLDRIDGFFQARGHEFVVRRDVEQLTTVSSPLRVCSASGRNPDLAAWLRKGIDVDLVLAGFIRLVCHPARPHPG